MTYNEIRIDVINTIKFFGFLNKDLEVTMDDKLSEDLGMDSLDVIELEVELEKKHLIKLGLTFLETPWTVRGIVNKIYSLKCDEA